MLLLPWPATADACPPQTSQLVKRQHKASIFMAVIDHVFDLPDWHNMPVFLCVHVYLHACVCIRIRTSVLNVYEVTFTEQGLTFTY